MPGHKAHCFLDKQLYGQEYPWVHRIKDLPVRKLGFKHRTAMHDPETSLLLYLLSRSPMVFLVSAIHDAVDKAHSYKRRKRKKKI